MLRGSISGSRASGSAGRSYFSRYVIFGNAYYPYAGLLAWPYHGYYGHAYSYYGSGLSIHGGYAGRHVGIFGHYRTGYHGRRSGLHIRIGR